MSTTSRQFDAPSTVRGDSERFRRVQESVLKLLHTQLLPIGGSRREATIDLLVDAPPDSPDAILHHVFERLRQEHPEYTLRYGGVSPAGMMTVSILRTADVAAKGVARVMGSLDTAGFLVRGGE